MIRSRRRQSRISPATPDGTDGNGTFADILIGVVGVEAEQEEADQRAVQPIETGRRARCNRIGAPTVY